MNSTSKFNPEKLLVNVDNNSEDEAKDDKLSLKNGKYKKNDDIVSDKGFWMKKSAQDSKLEE